MIMLPVHDPSRANAIYAGAAVSHISSASTTWKKPEPATPEHLAPDQSGPTENSLELRLYNNIADLKIDFAERATHLPFHWRNVIFSQLDGLLSLEAWNEDSAFLSRSSFRTFLRFVTYVHPERVPTLGVDHSGNLIAAWMDDPLRVFATFLPNDSVGATLIGRTKRGEEELTAWSGPVQALGDFIARAGNSCCLGIAQP